MNGIVETIKYYIPGRSVVLPEGKQFPTRTVEWVETNLWTKNAVRAAMLGAAWMITPAVLPMFCTRCLVVFGVAEEDLVRVSNAEYSRMIALLSGLAFGIAESVDMYEWLVRKLVDGNQVNAVSTNFRLLKRVTCLCYTLYYTVLAASELKRLGVNFIPVLVGLVGLINIVTTFTIYGVTALFSELYRY